MIYIGIGSNLGDRVKNIEKAKYFLQLNGVNIIRSSSFYETLSWPDKKKTKICKCRNSIKYRFFTGKTIKNI